MAVEDRRRRVYGLQYHPEVRHSVRGDATLRHFLFGISCIQADWRMENVLEEELAKLRALVRSQQIHKAPVALLRNLQDEVESFEACTLQCVGDSGHSRGSRSFDVSADVK